MKETFKDFKKFWKVATPITGTVNKNKIKEMKAELSKKLDNNLMWICYRNSDGEHEVIMSSNLSQYQPKLKLINMITSDSICRLYDVEEEKWNQFNWNKLVTYEIGEQHANI